MRDSVNAAVLSILLICCCCCCSFTRGDHDAGPVTASPSPSPPENSSYPQHLSNAEPNSFLNSTAQHLNISAVDSSTTDELSANGTQNENNTTDSTLSTEAPASAATAPSTAMDQLTAIHSTSVPGNLTDSQEGRDLSAGDNPPVSTTIAPVTTTLPTTLLPRTENQTNTTAPTTMIQTSFVSATSAHSTTVPNKSATANSETTAQTRRKSSTVSTKSATAPTTTMPQTMEASKPHNSTPFQAKARADTPSELNVGDDDSSASWDPLLAGLVSVFVVTAVIVSLLIFLKFRHRNERPEFRRLQDLPMDDMMEDTPLSMYSY